MSYYDYFCFVLVILNILPWNKIYSRLLILMVICEKVLFSQLGIAAKNWVRGNRDYS